MSNNNKVINFSPGPSKLPEEVNATFVSFFFGFLNKYFNLQVVAKVQEELINYQGTGISILEMSHRSSEFMQIVTNAQKEIQQLL